MEAIVVIGTSSGGPLALQRLLRALPADFPAPVCIVQHLGRQASDLAALLDAASRMPVQWAAHGAVLRPAHVYVAPPDRHVRVGRHAVEVTGGPRENFMRPAIDPLMRSAGTAFGAGAVGVVLTGRLGDGAAGMYELKRSGGTTIIQDPADAEYPDMPRNVQLHVATDHCVALDAIPPLLIARAAALAARRTAAKEMPMSTPIRDRHVAAFACPECGGAMERQQLGTLGVYCCDGGHRMTTDSLVDAQRERIDSTADVLARELREHAALCREIGMAAGSDAASVWLDTVRDAEQRLEIVRATFDAPWDV